MERSYRNRKNGYEFPHLIPEHDPAHLHAAQIESPAVKIGRIGVVRCRRCRYRDEHRKEIAVGGVTFFLCSTCDDEYFTDRVGFGPMILPMHASIHQRSVFSLIRAVSALALFTTTPTIAADKFATYGALSVFGSQQQSTTCFDSGTNASARLQIDRFRFLVPRLSSIRDLQLGVEFAFTVDPNGGEFSVYTPLPPIALEAWRSYPSLSAGVWDVVSIQKLEEGERLSDAIRLVVPPLQRCKSLSRVDVVAGDMQMSGAGQAFATPAIRVKVTGLDGLPAAGASVALASEVILNEKTDTGIDGPRTALLTDALGMVDLPVTAGSRPGVKRFVVKARQQGHLGAVSAMVTVAHVAPSAPLEDTTLAVEYSYDGGAGGFARYLASAESVVRRLDSYDSSVAQRTGQVWRVFTTPTAAPNLSPVCQFFGQPLGDGTVAHFFTANAAECALLRSTWGDLGTPGNGMKYEGIAFYAVAPDGNGVCPAEYAVPVVRYFVAQPSPYHLYVTTYPKIGRPMIPVPWNASEERVAFCTDVYTAIVPEKY